MSSEPPEDTRLSKPGSLQDTEIMDQIQGKNIMITGAARGLGYKYAEVLLQNGAKCIAVIDLATSQGQESAETLQREFGKGKAVFFACDMTKEEEVKRMFKKVIATLGSLDVLINNAGMMNESRMQMTIDLNLTGLIRSTLIAMDYMRKNNGGNGGTIVNIASVLGLVPLTGLPVYTATKHAVIGFSQCIQVIINMIVKGAIFYMTVDSKAFHKDTGVRIMVMCPGVTITPLLDNLHSMYFKLTTPEIRDTFEHSFKYQKMENVAQAMVELIQKGENGAVWVSEAGEPPYAVGFEHYSKRAIPV